MARKPAHKIVSEELLTRQVAGLLVSGASTLEISKQLDISWDLAKKLSNSNETRALVKEVGESALTAAKAIIRQRTAKMAEKVIDVIENQLAEGNLEAVKISLKILGFQDQEPVAQGAQNLTVILPGAQAKPAIDVESIVQNQEGEEV